MHTNSLIASHAFYLAVEGGTNRTSGITVQGAGPAERQVMALIFYRTFAFLLPSNASFNLARLATLQAARDLDPDQNRYVPALAAAWDAVGVTE